MDDFAIDMTLDANGILLVRMSGTFAFESWRVQRSELLRTTLAEVDFKNRASIVDIRDSDPPQEDWLNAFDQIREELLAVHEGTGPVAFVVGMDQGKAAASSFFKAINHSKGMGDHPVHAFSDMESALDWVLIDLQWVYPKNLTA